MPKLLTIDRAQRLLRSRDDLRDGGWTERGLTEAVRSGALIRVRRGWYVERTAWDGLWNEGRHLLAVLAVQRESTYAAPAFCAESAAVIHGLPLYRLVPDAVHTLVGATSHSRSGPGIARHALRVDPDDLTEVNGMRCTSMERTVLDLARRLPYEAAVASADAALRCAAVTGNDQDERIAEEWRARMLESAARRSPGIRQARRVIAFADGRAQLPGESVSRVHLDRLGFRHVGLQTHIVGPDGEDYWTDFAFAKARVFGEFDGQGKYRDDDVRRGRSTEEIVLAEKRREDAIRGVTGWRIVRWESRHLSRAEHLGARLAAFGVHP